MEVAKNDVVAIARTYLNDVRLDDITVAVDPSYIERREFAWHVGVRPSRYPARMYYLYDELAMVAEEIAEKEGLNVFFVVGEPAASEPELIVAAS